MVTRPKRHALRKARALARVKEWTPAKRTYDLLKGFLNISPHLVFKAGNGLATRAKPILAKAKIPESIPRDFAIFDGARFLKAFKPGDTLKLYANRVEVSGTTVYYSHPEFDPYKEPKPLSVDVRLSLQKDDYKELCRAAKDLGVDHVLVSGEGANIVLTATDYNDRRISKEIRFDDGGVANPKFQAVFEIANFNKLIPNNYYVEISKAGFARFDSLDGLEYWVALEKALSQFG